VIDTHKHCMYCGINIPPKEVFCSEKCQEAFTSQRQKVVKIQRFMILALSLVLTLVIFLNLR
jgi:predicted nucleic acid-binding Zn ribbon protein